MRFLALALSGAMVVYGSGAAAADERQLDPDEVICKQQAKVSTRFKTKICHTRAQWAAIAEQTKRDYAQMRDRPVIETRRE